MYTLVIAGLRQLEFDRLRRESANRVAPGGRLIVTPNSAAAAYASRHSRDLLQQAYAAATQVHEAEKLSTLLIYVDYGEETTQSLLDEFFPFSLPAAIRPFEPGDGSSKRVINERLNVFIDSLLAISKRLRDRARTISGFTDIANLTPLLLPLRNFQGKTLHDMLMHLYKTLGETDEPKALIEGAVKAFVARHPRVHPPGEDRHCFSDGQMYFKSPGKHRHGYFRNVAAHSHAPSCLLNARSRIGGAYDYRLHYDCSPTKGRLSASYQNCHDSHTSPKSTHVNIAPNDYII